MGETSLPGSLLCLHDGESVLQSLMGNSIPVHLRGLYIGMNNPVVVVSQRIDSYEHRLFAWPCLSLSLFLPFMPPSFCYLSSVSFLHFFFYFLTGSCVFQAKTF